MSPVKMMKKIVIIAMLAASIYSSSVLSVPVFAEEADPVTDFSVRMLKEVQKDDENVLVSPVSIMSALAMAANGGAYSTREQMEETLGMTVDELNAYFKGSDALNGEDGNLSMANSVWLKEDNALSPSQEFIQAMEDNYNADVSGVPMDGETLPEINSWVDEKTDGMIPEILDDINPDSPMYLINALAFEAKWENVYEESDVQESVFTKEDGEEIPVSLMHSEESVYLDGDGAEGFLKYYEGGKYAFAALLPDEGISLGNYIESLDGDKLQEIISGREDGYTVYTAIPKFKSESSMELSDALMDMGIKDAFTSKADFSNMYGIDGNPGVQIGQVLHKTFIEVSEQETKAAAVTAIEMEMTAAIQEEEVKMVFLDRPFLYMLIDCETYTSVFMGTMYSPA